MRGLGPLLLGVVAVAAGYFATIPLKRFGGDGVELVRAVIGLNAGGVGWLFLAPATTG